MMKSVSVLAVSALALLALGGCGNKTEAKAETAETIATNETVSTQATANGTQVMVLGNPDAKVTLVEFAALSCPHCATFHHTVLPQVKERLVDTGLVKIEFRDFPLADPENDPFSWIGFALSRCAADTTGKSDAYFETLGSLFELFHFSDIPVTVQDSNNQPALNPVFQTELDKIAAAGGLTPEAADECVARQDIYEAIYENLKTGSEDYDVHSTPSFFINKQRVEAKTTAELIEILEKAVAAANN